LKYFLPLFVFVLLLSQPFVSLSASQKQDKELDMVVSNIQKRYEQAAQLQADFIQESVVRALDRVQRAEGEVWFKKPGMMRWNYHTPNRDQIVSDGKFFWYYDQEEKLVVESNVADIMTTPTTTTFLQGLGNLNEQFSASFSESGKKDDKGNYVIDLEPKNPTDDELNRFTIIVDPKTWLVSVIHLYDPFGNLTRISFYNLQINKGISDSVFKFNVPKGVDVIRPPSSANGR